MKKYLTELRQLMEACREDELKDTVDGMILVPRKDMVNAYFDGYEKALRDVEGADPSGGLDLLREIRFIKHWCEDNADRADREADSYDDDDDELKADQAYAMGCARGYRYTSYQIDKLLRAVIEALCQPKMEKTRNDRTENTD